MTFATLRGNDRGSVALGPVYVIVTVILLMVLASALYTANVSAARSSAQTQADTAVADAITAMEADLNVRGAAYVASNLLRDDYRPAGWIAGEAQSFSYFGFEQFGGNRVQVTVQVVSTSKYVDDAFYTVEYEGVGVVARGGVWVEAAAGETPVRTVWTATRSALREVQ